MRFYGRPTKRLLNTISSYFLSAAILYTASLGRSIKDSMIVRKFQLEKV